MTFLFIYFVHNDDDETTTIITTIEYYDRIITDIN